MAFSYQIVATIKTLHIHSSSTTYHLKLFNVKKLSVGFEHLGLPPSLLYKFIKHMDFNVLVQLLKLFF